MCVLSVTMLLFTGVEVVSRSVGQFVLVLGPKPDFKFPFF
jgi:hypothetical protein